MCNGNCQCTEPCDKHLSELETKANDSISRALRMIRMENLLRIDHQCRMDIAHEMFSCISVNGRVA